MEGKVFGTPLELEELTDVAVFKKSIKEWKPKTNVGFVSYIMSLSSRKVLKSGSQKQM